MKTFDEFNQEQLDENQQVVDMVKKILNTGEFYDLQGKKRKGMTYDRLKQEMKYAGAKRIPSGVVFQSALRQAGLNIKAIGGSDEKNGKARSTVNYWTIVESLNEASDSDIDGRLEETQYELEDIISSLGGKYRPAKIHLKQALDRIEQARVYIDRENM